MRKYKMDKVALYKMFLVRVGFLGNKEDRLDKASLKMKVEELYKETGQKGMIVKFRETLLDSWQKQWEEGKNIEKTEKIGLERERTIEGILNLCLELKKVNMYRRYGQEALSFYEEIWEIKHAKMKDGEMKKFLRKLKELASSIEDYTSEKFYKNVLEVRSRLFINKSKQRPCLFCEQLFVSAVFSSLCTRLNSFTLQDLISDSPYFLPNNSYDVISDNLVLDQLVISLWIFFFILTTFLLVIALVL